MKKQTNKNQKLLLSNDNKIQSVLNTIDESTNNTFSIVNVYRNTPKKQTAVFSHYFRDSYNNNCIALIVDHNVFNVLFAELPLLQITPKNVKTDCNEILYLSKLLKHYKQFNDRHVANYPMSSIDPSMINYNR